MLACMPTAKLVGAAAAFEAKCAEADELRSENEELKRELERVRARDAARYAKEDNKRRAAARRERAATARREQERLAAARAATACRRANFLNSAMMRGRDGKVQGSREFHGISLQFLEFCDDESPGR